MFRGGVDFGYQRVGYEFAGLIVVGIFFEQLGMECPVFVNLRGEFNEIAVNRCAALAFEACT